MSEEAPARPIGPRVLLAGEASARPDGLERALTGAGFHLVERGSGAGIPADAVVITLGEFDEQALAKLLPGNNAGDRAVPPSIVVIASTNPQASAAALRLGASDALVAPVDLPELCARLHARLRDRRRTGMPENGRALASAPPDTGNDALEHRVQEEFERARRYSLSFSLVLLGIDELQGSEERLGLEAATRLRTEVSRTLRRELRIPDLVVPYGQGEFAIVLPETGESGARQSVVRVRERLTSLPFEADPRLEATRFSAGIVTFPHPAAQEPRDLFAMAEAALLRGRAQAIERIGVAV
ncbi:MAG TPA: diguanylate cyclase [Gemmatimonadales bacterium]|nr:diguanylate cyclase [Gemmatimonadales bacterium]